MLGREILVLHLFGFFLSLLKDGVGAGAEILLPAADLWKLRDRRLDLGRDRLSVGTDLAQNRPENALFLLEHRRQNVLGLDLLVLAFLGDANGFLHGLLAADRESVESHTFYCR